MGQNKRQFRFLAVLLLVSITVGACGDVEGKKTDEDVSLDPMGAQTDFTGASWTDACREIGENLCRWSTECQTDVDDFCRPDWDERCAQETPCDDDEELDVAAAQACATWSRSLECRLLPREFEENCEVCRRARDRDDDPDETTSTESSTESGAIDGDG